LYRFLFPAGCIIAVLFSGCSDDSSPVGPGERSLDLEYISPEEAGYSAEALNPVRDMAAQSGYAAIMALHDGKVFFSWGNTTKNYNCHSIRKPFLSALIGIHVQTGDIDRDATMAELGVDDIPPALTEAERQARVRHLLKARSGIYHEAAAEDAVMIATRPARGSYGPDEFYYYNNWDFNALGTIFEQETGTRIFEEFKSRIADPIGMQDFHVDSCYYQYELNKSEHPAYHFRMSCRDMARFGVLYQKNGNWDGTQIIPADWITESTTPYSVVDSASGISYGYMWRVVPEGSTLFEQLGFAMYFHTGVGVHALIVCPDLDLVVVQRYDTDGEWTDPGEVGVQMVETIIDARL
jgi:CubicO group peptidase (beta-lactamase class C family)